MACVQFLVGPVQFPAPFANQEAAMASNNGAYPPDFSVLAKARAPERGFPTFVFDIFTQYQESGPDYIVSLLTEGLVARGVEVTLFATQDSHTEGHLVGVSPRGLGQARGPAL